MPSHPFQHVSHCACLQILPYLLLFVYFGSLARNLADIFTGKSGLGTNTTIAMAAVRWVGVWWLVCEKMGGG